MWWLTDNLNKVDERYSVLEICPYVGNERHTGLSLKVVVHPGRVVCQLSVLCAYDGVEECVCVCVYSVEEVCGVTVS